MPAVYYRTLTTREVQQIEWEKKRDEGEGGEEKSSRAGRKKKYLINDYLYTKAVVFHIIEKFHKYQR